MAEIFAVQGVKAEGKPQPRFWQIPADALDNVKKLRFGRERVLRFFNRVEGAAALFASTPALAFMLADSRPIHGNTHPLRAARSLVKKKQRHIAGWLGFPDSEAAVRMLRRLWPGSLHRNVLLHLRYMLGQPGAARRLAHAGDNLYAVVVMHMCGMNLELALGLCGRSIERIYDIRLMWNSCVSALEEMELPNQETLLKNTRTVCELRQLMAWARDQHDNIHDADRTFPAPPLTGDDDITPLTDTTLLKAEAEGMKSCVFGYRHRILRGTYYVYRMTAPERCTIGLIDTGAGWRVDTVKLMRNCKPKKRTVDRVIRWVEKRLSANKMAELKRNPIETGCFRSTTPALKG